MESVEPVKLLEYAPKLILGYGRTVVYDADNGIAAVKRCVYLDLRAGEAIQHRVAQKIVENALNFARVATDRQRL